MRPLVVDLVAALALGTIGSTATVGSTTTVGPTPTATTPSATAANSTATPSSTARTASAPTAAATEPSGFWTGPINDAVPATLQGATVIHTRELAALLKRNEGNAVLVDVSNAPRRPENLPSTTTWLPVPHPAIPGAIWIPGAGLGAPPPPIDEFFRQRLATATGNDMRRPLILYCHEKCWLSWNGAKRAIQYGYRNVYWFPDGIEGWRKARLPTAIVEPEATP